MNEFKHVGEVLNNLLLEKGVGQIILATDTGITPKTINGIIKGRCSISPYTAVLFERYFPVHTAEDWLNLQMDFDLKKARLKLEKKLSEDIERAKALALNDDWK